MIWKCLDERSEVLWMMQLSFVSRDDKRMKNVSDRRKMQNRKEQKSKKKVPHRILSSSLFSEVEKNNKNDENTQKTRGEKRS